MNIFKKISSRLLTVVLLTATFSLVGCGGSSSGSSSDDNSISSGQVAPDQNLAKLQIDQANELRSVSELLVEVRMDTTRSFLSICPDPGKEMDVASLDYDSCLIRSPLRQDSNSFSIDIPNHVDRLVAIIWFYETGKTPITERWHQQPGNGFATGTVWRIDESG